MIVGVDASRSRSGGAVAHIKGILSAADPRDFGIRTVHLWGHDALLAAVADAPWLEKHDVPASRRSMLEQLAWQRFALPRVALKVGLQVIFNTDAGSVCPFQPSVTLSQDMLAFEPGEIARYPWLTRARLRLEVLRMVQLERLRRSTVPVFLSRYASRVVGDLASLREVFVLPHGIDARFKLASLNRRAFPSEEPIHCLYVSNAAPYKHQWNVVEAVALLRGNSGFDVRLRLVGGGHGPALARLRASIARNDPTGAFVTQAPFLPNEQVAEELARSDLFIFASSCENLPVTLLEAMASGIPIASSNRGPMPEVLGPDAVYFDPERADSIAQALRRLICEPQTRKRSACDARRRAEAFSWENCATETWKLLAAVARRCAR